ncbi:hypothetical protein PSHT_08991 [Puccinia striiformis]|uniref:CBM1 domain-containing protein n=1 Tax=Puccinia striiformis TaxID=27350 RepID=A0A2S4VKH2_9BASI|nr:hypothetical protein PSHT_08991 [Puccinia striiformis]
MNLIKSTTLLCMFGISTFARSQKCGGKTPLYACADGEIPLKSNLYIPWNDPDCKLNNKPIRWCCPDDGRMQTTSETGYYQQEERAATQARSPHKRTPSWAIINPKRRKPDTEKEIPSSHGNFDRIVEPFDLDSAPIQVAKWKSRETGLSVVWADVEGKLPYNRSHERTQSNPDIAST